MMRPHLVFCGFILFGFCAIAVAQNVEIEVYETAGVTVADYPVSAFIPLPFGRYQSISNFQITNSEGHPIPAQFWVRSRWSSRGNSIRELVAVFKASLAANEKKSFFLKHGDVVAPATPVTVTESPNSIEVTNGRVSFSVNKQYFNLLDSVSIDGQTVIKNTPEDGNYLINRFGKIYHDASPCTPLTPTVFEVEEAGPVRARIRIERPSYFVQDDNDPCFAQFSETKDPVPGFIVWLDLYYSDQQVYVRHVTTNSGITAYRNGKAGHGMRGWPLYYREAGINLRTTIKKPEVHISVNENLLAQNASFQAIQESDMFFSVNNTAAGIKSNVLTVTSADSTGFAIIDPLFHLAFPNGWKYDFSKGKATLLTGPEGCAACQGYQWKTLTNSGLYVIDDMSLREKHFALRLSSATSPMGNPVDLAKVMLSPPAAVLKPEHYSESGTSTDLFGIHNYLESAKSPVQPDFSSRARHKQLWGINKARMSACTSGGTAPTGMGFMMLRPPVNNELAITVFDDIYRPQYVPHYWSGMDSPVEFQAMQPGPDILFENETYGGLATEFTTLSYCKKHSIRSYGYGSNKNSSNSYFFDKVMPDGYSRSAISPGPRDNQHLWMQPLWDAPLDNPLLQHFKERYEQYLQTYAATLLFRSDKTAYPEIKAGFQSKTLGQKVKSVRGIANSLITLVDAYVESGSNDSLRAIEYVITAIALHQLESGTVLKPKVSFQNGYLVHGILNAMSVVPYDHQVFRSGWSVLFGGAEQRENLPGQVDAIISSKFGYYTEPECTDCVSGGPQVVSIDPVAVAAYLLATVPSPFTGKTDPSRAQNYIQTLTDYLDGSLGRRPYGLDKNWRTHVWKGKIARTTQLIDYWNSHPVSQWKSALAHQKSSVVQTHNQSSPPASPRNLRVKINH